GALPIDWVAWIARQVIGGLAACHAEGIVHRDLKPQNVMICRGGARIVLIDFGIARALDAPALTGVDRVVGTADYMAPEQLTNGPLGPNTDVYAAGILPQELILGSLAFNGDDT